MYALQRTVAAASCSCAGCGLQVPGASPTTNTSGDQINMQGSEQTLK